MPAEHTRLVAKMSRRGCGVSMAEPIWAAIGTTRTAAML